MTQQMKIKITDVEVGNAKTKKGQDYKFLEVTYKNLTFGDKSEVKKVMPFGSKEVYAALEHATKGDIFTLIREKDNDGYWQWVGITAGDVEIETAAPAAGAAQAAIKAAPQQSKSTFETPEERAKKQVFIIRQSSLATAVDLLKTDKKVPTVDEVVAVAKQFEDYVFGVNALPDNKINVEVDEEDIPY